METRDNINNWPQAHYELQSIEERRENLLERLSSHPDDSDDLERLRLFEMRYKKREDRFVDNFIDAWMTIRLYQNPGFLFQNEKLFPSEMKEQAEKLGLTGYPKDEFLFAEWEHFARLYLKTCLSGSTYKSRVLMFFPLDADKLALKIAEDIDLGTSVLPRIAGLEEAFSPLREIFIKSYKEMVAGGNKYWEQYLKEKPERKEKNR